MLKDQTKVVKYLSSEKEAQKTLVDWCMLHPILKEYILHIPNEGPRSQHFGNLLKRLGMRIGASDLFLPYPVKSKHGYWPGLWLEMKRQERSGTVISSEQKQWLMKMHKVGYAIAVAYGFEEGKVCLETYLKGDPLPLPPFIKEMLQIASNRVLPAAVANGEDFDSNLYSKEDTDQIISDFKPHYRYAD